MVSTSHWGRSTGAACRYAEVSLGRFVPVTESGKEQKLGNQILAIANLHRKYTMRTSNAKTTGMFVSVSLHAVTALAPSSAPILTLSCTRNTSCSRALLSRSRNTHKPTALSKLKANKK